MGAREEKPHTEVLYIAGAGRSGSTLLERMLHERLGAVACGELWRLWGVGLERDYACSCGDPFSSCSFWSVVEKRMPALRESAPTIKPWVQRQQRGRTLPGNLWRSWLRPRRDQRSLHLRQLLETVADVAGTRLLIDSSKSPIWCAYLASLPGIEMRVLHLVRDSRGVVASWSKKKSYPARLHDPWMRTYSLPLAARHWNHKNGLSLMLRMLPGRYARIRYEDLVADPEAAIAGAVETLALQGFQRGTPDGSVTTHQVWGNPSRDRPSGLVEVRNDERWVANFGAIQQRQVIRRTWPLHAWFGYSLRSRKKVSNDATREHSR